jgi:hypothetical protein
MTEDERKFKEQQKNARIASPIYIEIPGKLTEEGLEALAADLQHSLLIALNSGEKIPYTDAGNERVQQMFKECYERIMAKTHITISVIVEK